ncbi:MFS transporter [Sporomusa sphaeroides]|uniref:MFS transporter n=1 Tax=Sporomusa sphaeroides TaxID=47679 RepID=UPI003BAFFA1B
MLGVFSILNTEMGIIGVLPLVAEHFYVSISQAGLLVSLFALAVAISGPTLPLLFSGINRKQVMLLALGGFLIGNTVSIFTSDFTIAVIARVVPAFFHPIYVSLAFTVAAASVNKEEAPKAVSKVFIGVSAGMVLGVPVSSFIASTTSLGMAMLFFAAVNAVAFIATLIFVPSMPVHERLSYGEQVRVLRKSITWVSIAAALLMNGAVFGVFSYLAGYLESVTKLSWNIISLLLLIYGSSNIIGNIIAGKLLVKRAAKTIMLIPLALGAVYILLLMGTFTALPMGVIILVWGILAGINANVTQYLIMSAAPEAPDFANGLFLTAVNLGTTIGAAVCGLFISEMGMQYILLGGLLFLLVGAVFSFLKVHMSSAKPLAG